jgi:flagellar motor protein MotB
MTTKVFEFTALGLFLTFGATAQTQPETVPLYRVTVVERTVKAVDYQYRSGPTQIDFRGTVLLTDAKGGATVESKQGRTEIDAHFEHIAAPTRFGREYLTYVLWAITPQGNAKNLGEVMPGSSDKAKLHVTTDLQAFGLLITAEPYSAVRQPSDVVVMENEVRPDTIGGVEPIQVKYDLMPRGAYTYNVPTDLAAVEGNGPRVSMGEYETLLEVYQAQNAVQIARSTGAAEYAADTIDKADQLLRNARDMQARKVDKSLVITAARQAAQTAEDARTLTLKRKQDAELASAHGEAAQERELRLKAEAALRAQTQASADRTELDRERAAREQAESQAAIAAAAAAAAQQTPPPAEMDAPVSHPPQTAQMAPPVMAPMTAPMTTQAAAGGAETYGGPQDARAKRDLRMSLYQQLSGSLQARDTPAGLVVTIPDAEFHGGAPDSSALAAIARVDSVLAAHPGLMVEVDGNSDTPEGDRTASERATMVREALVRGGLPVNAVTARGLGSGKLLGPNRTAPERAQNRRVEIVITGEQIGSLPYWDKTYSITPR